MDVVDEVGSSGPFKKGVAMAEAEMDHQSKVQLETCRHLSREPVLTKGKNSQRSRGPCSQGESLCLKEWAMR